MTTTTVLSDDAAVIVRDGRSRFDWGAVFAGAVVAAAITFFLVSVGSGLGLALTSVRNASSSGVKTFLTLSAIFFIAAQAFGFAVGGHVTGRMMGIDVEDSEEENFRTDAHGLAVWALAVVFGLGLAAVATLATASTTASHTAAPASYWADRLLAPLNQGAGSPGKQPSGPTDPTSGNNIAMPSATLQPNSGSPSSETLADAKAEAGRLLAVDAAKTESDPINKAELTRLVTQYAGLPGTAAADRVRTTEQDLRDEAKAAADAARKAASYLAIWTAIALLFGAVVCVVATLSARWKEDHDIFGRPRSNAS